jgi:valyl-tRNA synthetase
MINKQFNNLTSGSIWILEKYSELEKNLEKNLQNYELAHSINQIYKFLWDDFASWYIEYIKTDKTQLDFAKNLYKQFIITLSPYLPFETEVLWKNFFQQKSVLALELKDFGWTNSVFSQNQEVFSEEFKIVLEFVSNLRSLRGLFVIDPQNLLKVYADLKFLANYKDFLKLVAKTELVDFNELNSNNLYKTKTINFEYSLNILDYIKDKKSEINRTQKLIESLKNQIKSLKNQLENSNFLQKAGILVIEEKKQDKKAREAEQKAQEEKLEFLSKQD